MRRSIVTGFTVIAALSAGCSDPAAPVTPANIVGEWWKVDDALPSVNLSITRDGSRLHARLRLSGVEANGTATVDGRRLTLALQGRAEPMLGEVVSDTQLDLQLAPGASYRLQKQ